MNLELKDLKRYELELDNCLAVILAANRANIPLDEVGLATALGIDQAMTDKLILKLQSENIIK